MSSLPNDERYEWAQQWQLWMIVKYDYGTGQWGFKQYMPHGWQPTEVMETPRQSYQIYPGSQQTEQGEISDKYEDNNDESGDEDQKAYTEWEEDTTLASDNLEYDNEKSLHELVRDVENDFGIALDEDDGWAWLDFDLALQMHEVSTQWQHWKGSIAGFAAELLNLGTDSATKKTDEDMDTRELLVTIEMERPYLSGVIISYLSDIRCALINLRTVHDGNTGEQRNAMKSEFGSELETSLQCLCSQLRPLSIYVQSKHKDTKLKEPNISKFQRSLKEEFERGRAPSVVSRSMKNRESLIPRIPKNLQTGSTPIPSNVQSPLIPMARQDSFSMSSGRADSGSSSQPSRLPNTYSPMHNVSYGQPQSAGHLEAGTPLSSNYKPMLIPGQQEDFRTTNTTSPYSTGSTMTDAGSSEAGTAIIRTNLPNQFSMQPIQHSSGIGSVSYTPAFWTHEQPHQSYPQAQSSLQAQTSPTGYDQSLLTSNRAYHTTSYAPAIGASQVGPANIRPNSANQTPTQTTQHGSLQYMSPHNVGRAHGHQHAHNPFQGSTLTPSSYAPSNQGKLPRGRGQSIQGTYPATPHYEKIDPSFYVRNKDFFFEGRVFAVIVNETAGSSSRNPHAVDYNTSHSLHRVKYEDNIVDIDIRKFVVVRSKREFCFACPIFTYSGRATTKPGVKAVEHGIIYSWGRQPELLQFEGGMTKPSLPVVMSESHQILDRASRIYYGIHHPIQYNVKVKDIGCVPGNLIPTLIGNWREEDEGDTQQEFADTQASEDLDESDDEYDLDRRLSKLSVSDKSKAESKKALSTWKRK